MTSGSDNDYSLPPGWFDPALWATQGDQSADKLAQILAQRARELATKPPAPATGQTVDVLVFVLDGEKYAIDVTHVQEIYPLTQLTPVPRTPDFVAGVFSARGRILSVIDLRTFFGLANDGTSNPTKIIVVTNTDTGQAMEVGILADDVLDVVTIFKKDIDRPLTTHTGLRVEYLQGITVNMLAVLNLNGLLNDERLIIHET